MTPWGRFKLRGDSACLPSTGKGKQVQPLFLHGSEDGTQDCDEDFFAKYSGNRMVELTEELQLPEGAEVLVAIPDREDEESDWARLATEQFLAGYDKADSVYDRI